MFGPLAMRDAPLEGGPSRHLSSASGSFRRSATRVPLRASRSWGRRFTIKCLEERKGKAQIIRFDRAQSTHDGREAPIVASSGEVA